MDAEKRLDPDAALDEREVLGESATPESVEGIFDLCDTDDDDDRVDLGGEMVQDEVPRNLFLKAAKTPVLLVLVSRFARVFIVVLQLAGARVSDCRRDTMRTVCTGNAERYYAYLLVLAGVQMAGSRPHRKHGWHG